MQVRKEQYRVFLLVHDSDDLSIMTYGSQLSVFNCHCLMVPTKSRYKLVFEKGRKRHAGQVNDVWDIYLYPSIEVMC